MRALEGPVVLTLFESTFGLPLTASLVAWFVLTAAYVFVRRLRPLCLHALMWGLVFGIPAFVVGYAGPIVLDWGGNQGPLLGILFTGPLGFVVGVLLGLLHFALRRGV